LRSASDDLPVSPSPGWLRRHAGKLLLSLLVAASCVWLLRAGGLPVLPPASSFAQTKWWTVGAYLAMWSVVHVLRAIRWTWLLESVAKVSLRRILAVSFVGFAAIALLPIRTGEAVRPLLIRKEGELSGWTAMGTIAAERIIDGLLLSVMLLTGLALSTPLSPLPDHIGDLPVSPAVVPRLAYAALALFAVAFLVMGLFYAQRSFARRATERLVGWLSPKLATWLADRVEHVASGLGFLPNARHTVPFVLTTAAYWLLNAAGTWLVAWGVGFENFSFVEGMVTTGVVALGLLAPNAPGFFGAYQISFYAGLAVFYPREMVIGPGAACVALVYSCQLFLTIAGAGLGFLLERTDVRLALEPDAAGNLAGPGPTD